MDYSIRLYRKWSSFSFLHNFKWITFSFSVMPGLVLVNCFCLLCNQHSFLFPLFTNTCYSIAFLSIFTLIKLVLLALFCVAIKRASVSLLRFPFLSPIQAFSCAMWPVCRLKYPCSCFSSHFYFLDFAVFLFALMLALVAIINFICSF